MSLHATIDFSERMQINIRVLIKSDICFKEWLFINTIKVDLGVPTYLMAHSDVIKMLIYFLILIEAVNQI